QRRAPGPGREPTPAGPGPRQREAVEQLLGELGDPAAGAREPRGVVELAGQLESEAAGRDADGAARVAQRPAAGIEEAQREEPVAVGPGRVQRRRAGLASKDTQREPGGGAAERDDRRTAHGINV